VVSPAFYGGLRENIAGNDNTQNKCGNDLSEHLYLFFLIEKNVDMFSISGRLRLVIK
jgi:hypothetical protein